MRFMPIDGKISSFEIIKKVISLNDIQPKSEYHKKPVYDLEEVSTALIEYRKSSKVIGSEKGDEYFGLRKDKLRKDIREKQLKIEQMENTLIPYDQVYQYLVERKTIEMAILRRILLTNMPTEVPGLDIAKARDKAETYYNEIVKYLNESTKLWKKQYKCLTPEDQIVKDLLDTVKQNIICQQ